MKRSGYSTSLVWLVSVVTLAGCAVGPEFKRPDPPHAERYTSQKLQVEASRKGDASAQHVVLGEQLARDWWQLFKSDTIDDVVKRALAGNRTLVAAAATLAQAQELAAAQAGTRYPQVDLTGSIGRQKYGEAFLGSQPKPPPFTYFAVGPTVSYALDYTGGIARSVEQQYALAEYQRQQLGAAYLAVSGNAVMQLLQIASVQAQLATVAAILVQERENLKLVNEAFAPGSVSTLATETDDSQLASDTALMPPLRQELR